MQFINLLVLTISLNNLQSWIVTKNFFSNYFILDYSHIPWHFLIAPFFYMFLIYYLEIEKQQKNILKIILPTFLLTIVVRIGFIYFYSKKTVTSRCLQRRPPPLFSIKIHATNPKKSGLHLASAPQGSSFQGSSTSFISKDCPPRFHEDNPQDPAPFASLSSAQDGSHALYPTIRGSNHKAFFPRAAKGWTHAFFRTYCPRNTCLLDIVS